MDEEDVYSQYYHQYYDYTFEKSPEQKFIRYMYLVIFPYFLLFGTLGNLATFLLMRRYSYTVWSTCLYMMIALPLELVKLYVECGNDWYMKIHDDMEDLSIEILHLSNAVCKVYIFTYNLIRHLSMWIVVAMAIEVTIAINKPFKIYKMCTRDRAVAVVLFISVLLISLNLHFFWTMGLTIPGDDPTISVLLCTYINELSNDFRDTIWPAIDFVVGDLLPMITLITCCVLSIPKFQKKGNQENSDEALEKYFLDLKTLQQLKISFVVASIGAALTAFVHVLEYSLSYLLNSDKIDMDPDQWELFRAFVRTITYLYLSHNFFIFFVTCEKFRQDVTSVFCRPCTKIYHIRKTRTCIQDQELMPKYEWRSDSESECCNASVPKYNEMQLVNIPEVHVDEPKDGTD